MVRPVYLKRTIAVANGLSYKKHVGGAELLQGSVCSFGLTMNANASMTRSNGIVGRRPTKELSPGVRGHRDSYYQANRTPACTAPGAPQSACAADKPRQLPRTVGITIDVGTGIETRPFKPGSVALRSFDYKTFVTAQPARASHMEQNLGVSITGTQEQSSVVFGGVTDYVWFPWGLPGRAEFGYGCSLSYELIPEQDYPELEQRMAISRTGHTRASADVNAVWTRKLATKAGHAPHQRKLELSCHVTASTEQSMHPGRSGGIR
jgi:hypothetical protein